MGKYFKKADISDYAGTVAKQTFGQLVPYFGTEEKYRSKHPIAATLFGPILTKPLATNRSDVYRDSVIPGALLGLALNFGKYPKPIAAASGAAQGAILYGLGKLVRGSGKKKKTKK